MSTAHQTRSDVSSYGRSDREKASGYHGSPRRLAVGLAHPSPCGHEVTQRHPLASCAHPRRTAPSAAGGRCGRSRAAPWRGGLTIANFFLALLCILWRQKRISRFHTFHQEIQP